MILRPVTIMLWRVGVVLWPVANTLRLDLSTLTLRANLETKCLIDCL